MSLPIWTKSGPRPLKIEGPFNLNTRFETSETGAAVFAGHGCVRSSAGLHTTADP